MMMYSERLVEDDHVEAFIHDLETGFTYTLVWIASHALIHKDDGDFLAVVFRALTGKEESVLYKDETALEFWKLLLSMNPRPFGNVSPYELLRRLPGCEAPAAVENDKKDPF